MNIRKRKQSTLPTFRGDIMGPSQFLKDRQYTAYNYGIREDGVPDKFFRIHREFPIGNSDDCVVVLPSSWPAEEVKKFWRDSVYSFASDYFVDGEGNICSRELTSDDIFEAEALSYIEEVSKEEFYRYLEACDKISLEKYKNL